MWVQGGLALHYTILISHYVRHDQAPIFLEHSDILTLIQPFTFNLLCRQKLVHFGKHCFPKYACLNGMFILGNVMFSVSVLAFHNIISKSNSTIYD